MIGQIDVIMNSPKNVTTGIAVLDIVIGKQEYRPASKSGARRATYPKIDILRNKCKLSSINIEVNTVKYFTSATNSDHCMVFRYLGL